MDQIDFLFKAILELMDTLRDHKFAPRVLTTEDKIPIGFEPLEFQIYSGYNSEEKLTFNEAIDEFFAYYDNEELFSGDVKAARSDLTKTEKTTT